MKYKEYKVSVGSTALCIELSHHHVVWCTFIAYVNESNWKTTNRIQIHDLLFTKNRFVIWKSSRVCPHGNVNTNKH